jgi:hypothetical protein
MSDETANAVQTIEEAWEALEDELLHAPGAQGTVIGAEDAARALALASLEAACPFPPQVCARYAKQSAVHCLHQVVRAEIEKLGR